MSANRFVLLGALLAGLVWFTSCSSTPQPKPASEQKAAAEAKKEPVLYTAQECLKQLEGQAHLWAMDAKPFHIESIPTSESRGLEGKSAVWSAWFASPSRQSVRTFFCSGSRDPNAPVFGVTRGGEMPYDPKFVFFESFLLKTDSDKAFTIADGRGGQALLKKNPDQPVTYLVEMERGQSVPYWYVIYGKTLKENKGIGVINATTGSFVRAGKASEPGS